MLLLFDCLWSDCLHDIDSENDTDSENDSVSENDKVLTASVPFSKT